MSFIKHEGKTKNIKLPVTVSTAIAARSLVALSSGQLIAATSTTARESIVGVLVKAIASTDSDFATERLVDVEVPVEKSVIYEAAVTSGLVAADVGLFQDLTDAATVNRAASTYDVVQCVRVLSTTKGLFLVKFGEGAV